MAKLLIIDDDPELRQTMKQILEHDDHFIVEAQDGRQGVEQFENFSPDLIIVDIEMPNVDGLQAITQIKNSCPGQKIIAISGIPRHSQDCLMVARQIGAEEVLEKPFSATILAEAVRRVLGR